MEKDQNLSTFSHLKWPRVLYPLYIMIDPLHTIKLGIDIDCMKGHVYWTDTTNRQIKRADISGKNPETFLSDGLKFPEGIAIDWVSRNVYWTDPGQDTIEVNSLSRK